jgi:adenosylcobinamide-phosphate synthase
MISWSDLITHGSAANRLAVIAVAVGLEAAYSELPSRVHPVVWVGNLTRWLLQLEPRGNVARFVFGCGLTLLLIGAFAALFWGATRWLPAPASVFVEAVLLHTTFAVSDLRAAGRRMRAALGESIVQARAALSHLCSRDPAVLDERQLIGATLESLVENTCDSFVAPLACYAVGGLPAAVAYRVVNTLDAMIGYRGRYEYTGKFAARLDDALNFVPARISGLLLLLVGAARGYPAARGFAAWASERNKTASPNAGTTMSIAAGLLGVCLEKRGEYALNGGSRCLCVDDIREVEIWVGWVFGLWVFLLAGLLACAAWSNGL